MPALKPAPSLKASTKLSDEAAVNYVLERVDARSESYERRALERLWFGNYNYWAGAQNWISHPALHGRPWQLDSRRPTHQANLILPKVMRAIAKLQQINGTFRVAPKSAHRLDRHAAKMAEKVYAHLKQVTRFREYRAHVQTDAALYGSGFLKITWDPDAGQPGRVWLADDGKTVDSTPEFDPEARQIAEQEGRFKDIAIGEARVDVPSPFQLHWPTSCRTGVEDAAWMSQVQWISPEQAWDRYGIEVEGTSDVSQAELFERAIAFSVEVASGISGVNHGHVPREGQTRVREIEFWERPAGSNRGKGRRIVLLDHIVAVNDANPYVATGNALPFVKDDWFPARGKRFIGHSLVEQLRHPQRAYNRTRNHEIGFAATSGHARCFVPSNSGVKPVQLAGMNGTTLEMNMGAGAPVFAPVPQLPPYIGDLRNVARSEMDLISGQLEPTSNKMPGQLRSGEAVGLMQQDNNLILSPTVESMLQMHAKAGTMLLALASVYYTKPRFLRVLGRGNEYDPIEFMGSDLKGHTHLEIVGEPGPIESVETWRARISDMVALQLLDPTDPEDRAIALKAMEFHTDKELLSTKILQEIAEEREIQRMIDVPTYFPEAREWHDPATRMRVLERELNSRDFEDYKPQTQKKLELRWRQYVAIYSQRMQAQMEMMANMNGTPNEKGAASQPKPQTPRA